MTSLHRPSRWPHLLFEAGPSIAGVEVGDMLPVDVGQYVYLWRHRWSPFPAMTPAAVSRPAVQVRVTDRADVVEGRTYRVLEDPPRVERNDAALSGGVWLVEEPTRTGARSSAEGVIVSVSKWRFRFVLDGPPLATVRRFGPHVACRPRLVGTTRGGTHARSEWLVANGGARETLVVEQAFDGALAWQTHPRIAGVDIAMLRAALSGESRALDREIAAGIVAQLDATPGSTIVGFDGVVRVAPRSSTNTYGTPHAQGAQDAQGAQGAQEALDALDAPDRQDARDGHIRVAAYRLLTANDALDDDTVARELAAVQPATTQEIAAVMRSLFSAQAAREAALVEECAVLAA